MNSKMSNDAEQNDRRWLILRAKIHEENIKTAFEKFRAEGIEPILIKGWAAAQNYPEKHQRYYSDIDLCVSTEFHFQALQLLKDEKVRSLNIDLHLGLRHLDTIDWNNLFENSRLVNIDKTAVRILRPEDHLRVLCIHWLNDGGAYKEKLLDIYYAINNRPADFDWDRCLSVVSENRRDWILKTIGLTHKYFNLDISNLPIELEEVKSPKWLIETIEKEWSSKIRLKPIHTFLKDKKQFWEQIKKRIPPNSLQATIELNGKFDNKPRTFYQIGSVFVRLKPSLNRLREAFDYYKKNK
jgi:Uncharacterised nucleotidyltransferase